MTAGSKIDYEALAQDALRGVVRTVLTEVARTGLPGDHHFYVSFDTRAPGVTLSKRLREKYPEEMTIVLQHRFWDLTVTEDRFEVKLTFDGIPERLVIPFAAILVFFDPSVRYGLQFEDPHHSGPDAGSDASEPTRPMVVAAGSETGRTTRVTRTGERSPRSTKKPKPAKPETAVSGPSQPPGGPQSERTAAPAPAIAELSKSPAGDGDEAKKPDGAQIVSLDAFRKK
jgi:hypothetical protein